MLYSPTTAGLSRLKKIKFVPIDVDKALFLILDEWSAALVE
jgi:hypothetical protein